MKLNLPESRAVPFCFKLKTTNKKSSSFVSLILLNHNQVPNFSIQKKILKPFSNFYIIKKKFCN